MSVASTPTLRVAALMLVAMVAVANGAFCGFLEGCKRTRLL